MGRLFEEAPLAVMVARVDYLIPEGGGAPKALELNATIPAMPAYADLAAHSWLRAAARARGRTDREAGELVSACGSHMERLRRRWWRPTGPEAARRPAPRSPSWRGRATRRSASSGGSRPTSGPRGTEVENLLPTECVPEDWDLLYRHVWAHRVPPDAPFARALLAPGTVPALQPGQRAAGGQGALRAALRVRRGRRAGARGPGSTRPSGARRRGCPGRGGSTRRWPRGSRRSGAASC